MDPLSAAALGAVVAAIALPFAIRALVRRARLDAVATLAVAVDQPVELPAGELVLHLAGPLGKRGLGDLSFTLSDARGAVVAGAPIVLRSTRSSGRWGVLLAVRRFTVPAPGAHRLSIANIAADRDLSDCAIVLARPQGAGLAVAIVAVVVASVALVVCSVLGLVLWTGTAVVDRGSSAVEEVAGQPT